MSAELLAKLASLSGLSHTLYQSEISTILSTNYAAENILIKAPITFAVHQDLEKAFPHYFVVSEMPCMFPDNSTIPEIGWDHIAGSLIMIIANQVGKLLYCSHANTNGVNLLSFNAKIRKAAPIENIKVALKSELFVKANLLWAKSVLDYYYIDQLFANFNCLTHGIQRQYKTPAKPLRKNSNLNKVAQFS